MIAAEGYGIGYLAEPLGKYRWRTGSLMGNSTRLLEDYVQIYDILLQEKRFGSRHGEEAATILRDNLFRVQRNLAYHDRIQGRNESAKRRLANLIKERPHEFGLYADLLKAFLPAGLLSKLRTLKSHGL